jgi:hypothetical protein
MSESHYHKLGSWKTFIVHIVCIGLYRDKLELELMPKPKNSGTEYLVGGIRTPSEKDESQLG